MEHGKGINIGLKRTRGKYDHVDDAKESDSNVNAKRSSNPWLNYYKSEVGILKQKGDVKISKEAMKGMAKSWKNLDAKEKAKYDGTSSGVAHEMTRSFITRCCPERLWNLVQDFNDEQKNAINEIGFGYFVSRQIGRIDKKLTMWLVDQFDPITLTIQLHGKVYTLSSKDVERLMGLVDDGSSTEDSDCMEGIEELKKKYCTVPQGISIAHLQNRLSDKAAIADDDFKVLFTLFFMGTILSPNSGLYIKSSDLHRVKKVDGIRNQNWASWTFNRLVEGIKKYKNCKPLYISGCILVLQLFYLDVAWSGKQLVDKSVTQISAWGVAKKRKSIKLLKKRGGFESNTVETIESNENVKSNKTTDLSSRNVKKIEESQDIQEMKRDCTLKQDFAILKGEIASFQSVVTNQLSTLIQAVSSLKEAYDQLGSSNNVNTNSKNNLTFVCEICGEPKSANESFTLKGCSHSYCTDCITKYVASKLQENILKIGCPVLGCGGCLEPEYCHSILPPEVFDRWGNALCEDVIVGSHKFYCPFKDCSAMLIDDGKEVVVESECPNCRRLFCAQCKVAWHSGIVCSEFQKLNKDEREREDIMLMNLAQNKRWKRCPSCKIYVERKEGCLFMKCRCGSAFCYNCGNSFKQYDNHYCTKCKH